MSFVHFPQGHLKAKPIEKTADLRSQAIHELKEDCGRDRHIEETNSKNIVVGDCVVVSASYRIE
jgi:hypothetical protein